MSDFDPFKSGQAVEMFDPFKSGQAKEDFDPFKSGQAIENSPVQVLNPTLARIKGVGDDVSKGIVDDLRNSFSAFNEAPIKAPRFTTDAGIDAQGQPTQILSLGGVPWRNSTGSMGESIGTGLYNAGANVANGIFTPMNAALGLATMGTGPLAVLMSKLVPALFAAKGLASDIPKQLGQASVDIPNSQVPLSQKIEEGVGLGTSGLLTALMAKQSGIGIGPKPMGEMGVGPAISQRPPGPTIQPEVTVAPWEPVPRATTGEPVVAEPVAQQPVASTDLASQMRGLLDKWQQTQAQPRRQLMAPEGPQDLQAQLDAELGQTPNEVPRSVAVEQPQQPVVQSPSVQQPTANPISLDNSRALRYGDTVVPGTTHTIAGMKLLDQLKANNVEYDPAKLERGTMQEGQFMPEVVAPVQTVGATPAPVVKPVVKPVEDFSSVEQRLAARLAESKLAQEKLTAQDRAQAEAVQLDNPSELHNAQGTQSKAKGRGILGGIQAAMDKAKAERKQGGGIDMSIFEDVVKYGKSLYQKGIDKAKWASEMVGKIGEDVKPYLDQAWDHTKMGLETRPEQPMVTSAGEYLANPAKLRLGLDKEGKYDAGQAVARLMNVVPPDEKAILEQAGIKERFKAGQKVTPQEIRQWVDESGPKVETRVLGAQGDLKGSPEERLAVEQYEETQHQLETYGFRVGGLAFEKDLNIPEKPNVSWMTLEREGKKLWVSNEGKIHNPNKVRLSPNEESKIQERGKLWTRYSELTEAGIGRGQNESATARYQTVNPKPLKDMKGAVDLLVRVPVPKGFPKKVYTDRVGDMGGQIVETHTGVKYSSLHYPTEGKNLVVHVRGHEDVVGGEKVFSVNELQSDWAQHVRDLTEQQKQEGGMTDKWIAHKSNPLVKHYERLGAKAAIDHALKVGAKKVVVADAETAMMTEGHDTQSQFIHGGFKTKEEAIASREHMQHRDDYAKSWIVKEGKSGWEVWSSIPQEKGMRLHYDLTLPKIMEELTGVKGEKVELGEHQNALVKSSDYQAEPPQGFTPQELEQWSRGGNRIRPNLIFRNPDGSPKTTITGLAYDLSKVIASQKAGEKFTLMGKDRPTEVKPVEELRTTLKPKEKGITPKINPKSSETGAIHIMSILKDIKDNIAKFVKTPPNLVAPAPSFGRGLLPDLMPKDMANAIFSKPFAAERIPIIGKVFLGGKSRISTPQDRGLATWYMERHGVGPSLASLVGEAIHKKINGPFKVAANGNMNVTVNRTGLSVKPADVFEELQRNPTAYNLTPAQRDSWVNVIKPLLDRRAALVRQYNLANVLNEDGDFQPYFPRMVVEVPNKDYEPFPGGGKVGARQPFQKARFYQTEEEGWNRGVKYETDLEARLVNSVKQLYKAMADQRLISDPIMGARSRTEVVRDLRVMYPRYAPARIEQMADIIVQRGGVHQPGMRGMVFDTKTANALNSEFNVENSDVRRWIGKANSASKVMQLGFDFGVGQLQLLPTMFAHPVVWGEAQWRAVSAMAVPDTFASYVRNNEEAVSQMAQLGSSVGRLQEMLAGAEKGQWVTKVPIVGPVAEAFGRQFQTAMDVAKIELWKALRESAPRDEWPQVLQGTESMLGSSRMESAMTSSRRALTERVMLMAPSYYRSALNFVASMGEGGSTGKNSMKAMGAFLFGSVALFVAVATALKMSEDEIKKRLNPANPAFMMWQFKHGNDYVNMGFGGVFRSLARLGGKVVKTAIEHPENFLSGKSDTNPFMSWYRSHSSPVMGAVQDAATGSDFLGRKKTLLQIGANLATPLTVQDLTRDDSQPKITKKELFGSQIGLSSFPGRETLMDRMQDDTKQRFGQDMNLENLTFAQRKQVAKDVKKGPQPLLATIDQQEQIAMQSDKKKFQQMRDLTAAMKPDVTNWLKTNNLALRNYDNTFKNGRYSFPMTKGEQAEYATIIPQKYDSALRPLMNRTNVKQALVDARLEQARLRAQKELRSKVGNLQ